MPLFASDIFNRARAALNDRAGDVYTNEALIDYLNNAWAELQSELQVHGLPVTTQTTDILEVPANTIVINTQSTPQLPENFIEPLDVYERVPGTKRWNPMKESPYGLFKGEFGPRLGSWRWEEDGIQLIGSYSPVEVLVRYTRAFPELIGENTPIPLVGAKLFLAYRTAEEGARFVGQNTSRADSLAIKAEWEKSKYISTRVNGLQGHPVRKRGFATPVRSRTHLPF